MEKPKSPISISYCGEYLEEYNYVNNLKDKGINKRFWIYQAIREKMQKEENEKEVISELVSRIEQLEKQVKEIPKKVVHLSPQPRIDVPTPSIINDEEIDEDLLKAAGSFEF